MKKLLALSALAIVMSAPVAMAQDDGPRPHGEKMKHMMEAKFAKDDLNGDGQISKDEYLKSAETRFEKMDANSDGNLTKEELKQHHEEKRAKMKELKDKKDAKAPE